MVKLYWHYRDEEMDWSIAFDSEKELYSHINSIHIDDDPDIDTIYIDRNGELEFIKNTKQN